MTREDIMNLQVENAYGMKERMNVIKGDRADDMSSLESNSRQGLRGLDAVNARLV